MSTAVDSDSKGATLRSLGAALAAALGYGGWAWLVNAPMDMGMRAALIQGGYAFTLTLTMTLVMEAAWARARQLPGALWWLTAGIAAINFGIAYAIHALAGTPRIVATILPGFLIGSGYTLTYFLALRRLGQAARRPVDGA
ncbi:MAG: hypothetical protein AAF515_05245 [Pseudomonadota bacterium]